MAESKMGEEEACLNKKQKKRIQVKRCDRRGLTTRLLRSSGSFLS